MRRHNRRTVKEPGIRSKKRGGTLSNEDRKQDVEGRDRIRSLEDIARDKARFVAWMDANAGGSEAAAAELKDLRKSKDPRVRMRAVELETRIRGFFEEKTENAGTTLVINVGVPELAKFLAPKPLELPPATPA